MSARLAPKCLLLLLACTPMTHAQPPTEAARPATIQKIAEVVVYRSDAFYCAFPSIVRQPDGELLLAFRRAPDRRHFGGRGVTHTDANAQLVLTRSRDGGRTWTAPSLLHADPLAGLQDPCLALLDDGSMLCATYGWMWLPAASTPAPAPSLKDVMRAGDFVFTGGQLLRSADGGASWANLDPPPALPMEARRDPFGRPVPAYNRGAMCQGRDGRLYWAVAVAGAGVGNQRHTAVHLLTSDDRGRTWTYRCPIAQDEKVEFNEASLYQTPAGDLVAFVRTANLDDHTVVARSRDGGKSFATWEDAGFQGHPHHATRLSDGRVLLVYGYRHPPFGVRARVLDPECRNVATAPEFIVRDDGGNADLGYPWASVIDNDRALVVYYFNRSDGPRYIAGTILRIAPPR